MSSANNTGSHIEFILRGRSFLYIMNNGGPRIDSWGTPYFTVPKLEKQFLVVLGDVYFNFLASLS